MMYNFWLNELHQEKEIVNDISFLKLLLWTRTPATTAQKCTNNTPSFLQFFHIDWIVDLHF